MNLVLNENYVLKPDLGFTLLLPKETILDFGDDNYEISFTSKLNPIHGAILSCFDGREENEAIELASQKLGISQLIVRNFISKITNNRESVGFPYEGYLILFPKNCLVYADYIRKDLPGIEEFNYTLKQNFSTYRHSSPTDMTIMLTTRCATNCIYCYADRRSKIDCKIPLQRLKELIMEARRLHMRSVDVIGGEFFLYKNWKELLLFMREYGYSPAISTKVPISEESVQFLSDINIKAVQISLDTLLAGNLSTLLDVKNTYIDKIKNTFKLFEKYNVKIFVHTVMTNVNDSIEDIKSVYDFIKNLKNIINWRIDKTSSSLYKGINRYDFFKPRTERLNEIISYIENQPLVNLKRIIIDGIRTESYLNENEERKTKLKVFNERSMCSGNKSALFILPDGNVTICEELYWHKQFILGNVINQGLFEIWNSHTALDLHYIPQSEIPNDSACASCKSFEECRWGRGICYRNIMKAYGEDKWYYPDNNCPKAPTPLYEVMV